MIYAEGHKVAKDEVGPELDRMTCLSRHLQQGRGRTLR